MSNISYVISLHSFLCSLLAKIIYGLQFSDSSVLGEETLKVYAQSTT